MTRKVNPVPNGFRTVTPVLTVAGASTAIDFYAYVFAAEERTRVHGVDGLSIAHSELKIGNSLVIINDENPAFGIHAPTTIGASPVAVHLYVADVDAVWQRAVESGVTVVAPLADTYWGERYGKFIDPYGHVWSLAMRTERLTADEIAARAAPLSAVAPVELAETNEAPVEVAVEVGVEVAAEFAVVADEASKAA
jgi:PhnB protein